MAQKVSNKEVERLQKQKIEKNELVDGVDAVDRSLGRIPSKLGEALAKEFFNF